MTVSGVPEGPLRKRKPLHKTYTPAKPCHAAESIRLQNIGAIVGMNISLADRWTRKPACQCDSS